MYIIQVTTELAPVAKVGGLADVVTGLSRELEIRGNTVEIVLPKYDIMRYDQIWGLSVIMPDLWVPWYNASIHCSVLYGEVHNRRCFFIDPHSDDNFFNRRTFYGTTDDFMRFAFFSKAALEFLLKTNKRPDIIHCHDWQTGLIPVMLFEIYKHHGMENQRVCYTIHNFKHQGLGGVDTLFATGLNRPEYYFNYEQIRDNFNPFGINFMKAGIVYANFVTTVSPQHAWEVRNTDQGFGLQHTLEVHQGKFTGILNGIDYDVWNPEIDRFLPVKFSINSIDAKYGNKEALRNRFWLRKDYKPIVAYVGRLDAQKGVHLIRHAIFYSLNHGAQFVLLGLSPEHSIGEMFAHLKSELNESPDCHIELGFNEELSHLIYAGADLIIVPSTYEPCGLTQMIGLKYGTVPVVRAIGGLVDTVFDKDYSDKSFDQRNGFVFHQSDPQAMDSAISRAISLWHDFPDDFRRIMIHGMRYDFSWKNPGEQYTALYEHVRHK